MGIGLVLLFLLLSNIRLWVRYENDEIALKAGWLFLRYSAMPKKEEKNKKKKKSKNPRSGGQQKGQQSKTEKQDRPAEADGSYQPDGGSAKAKGEAKIADTPEKSGVAAKKAPDQESRTLRENGTMVLELLRSAKGPLKTLHRHLWLRDLDFLLVVAREDAAQTAIAYGRMNGWVHGAYAALSRFVRMKKAKVRVAADYLSQEDRLQVSFQLTVRTVFVLAAAAQFSGGFLWRIIKDKQTAKTKAE